MVGIYFFPIKQFLSSFDPEYFINTMNKSIILILIISLFFLASCSDESDLTTLSIGDNFVSSQTHISLIDSFSVKLSTFVIDSFAATTPDNILAGRYTDEYLGEISSTAYFQMDAPEFDDVDDEVIFDSLTFVLNYNGMSYGDTTKAQTLSVHEVLQEIEETDGSYIYNTSAFKYDDTPIGSKTFTPRPNKDDTLSIRLDDALGEKFLQMMKDNDNDISSTSEFIDFFKGLALVPGNENATILGFECVDSLVSFRLYTHTVGLDRSEKSYTFKMYTTESTYFNSIKTDRTGTEVENLITQKEELSSDLTGSKAFIQGGTGIVARVDFTGLNQIMELNYRYILYKAELVLRPYTSSDSQVDFPEELMLYTTDKSNRLVSEIQNDDDETLIADFYFDKIYRKEIYYKFDITDFLMDELSDGYFDSENGLVVSLPSDKLKSSAERLIIDGRGQDLYRPTLNLYFIFYN